MTTAYKTEAFHDFEQKVSTLDLLNLCGLGPYLLVRRSKAVIVVFNLSQALVNAIAHCKEMIHRDKTRVWYQGWVAVLHTSAIRLSLFSETFDKPFRSNKVYDSWNQWVLSLVEFTEGRNNSSSNVSCLSHSDEEIHNLKLHDKQTEEITLDTLPSN